MNKQSNTLFPNPFWDYSLRIYGNAAVRDCCLMLQDQHQADVNVLLFLCWRAENGVETTDPNGISAITASIHDIKTNLIDPLRKIRRNLKAALHQEPPVTTETMRQSMLKTELAAEALAQNRLYEAFPLPQSDQFPALENTAIDPRQSIETYLRFIGMTAEAASHQAAVMANAVVGSNICQG